MNLSVGTEVLPTGCIKFLNVISTNLFFMMSISEREMNWTGDCNC